MSAVQNNAFANLLRAWNQREDLRSHGAGVGAMVEARRNLDQARLEMARLRTN